MVITRFTFIVAILLLCMWQAEGQEVKDNLFLEVEIVDSIGLPVKFSWLKINPAGSKLLLLYQNIGDTNKMRVKLPPSNIDSLRITIISSGFMDASYWVIQSSIKDNLTFLRVILSFKNATLPDAIITAPPVWVRGDTTFFKADAFKDGGERKLKDIITKMPGFEITESGQLLYKKKAVDKITIEGEEIFAEKLQLMLNSFPVHVLENVQAIENQTNNPLLKGLKNEQRIFVNLALKKEKVKAAFGDGELAMGSGGRYLFNPVLFALYNKIKGGFIANYNSMGTGFDWNAENELKQVEEREAANWMMQQSLLIINNFEGRRYIKNRLFDNRLQVNIPVGKKKILKNEVSVVTDRQRQNSFFSGNYLNGDRITFRKDTNIFYSRPLIIQTQSKFEIRPRENQMLKMDIGFYGNFSRNNREMIYAFDGNGRDVNKDALKLKDVGSNGFFEWTNRKDANKAKTISLKISHQRFQQRGINISDQLGLLYGEAPEFNALHLNPALNRTIINLRDEWLKKKGNKTSIYGFVASYQKARYNIDAQFSDTSKQKSPIHYPLLSQAANQQNLKLGSYSDRTYFLNKVPLHLKLLGGAQSFKTRNGNRTYRNWMPWINFNGNVRFQLPDKKQISLSVKHEQDLQPLYRMIEGLRPSDLQQYTRSANITVPLSQSMLTSTFGWSKNKSSSLIYLTFNRIWNGQTLYALQDRFIQVLVDSMVRRPFNQVNIHYGANYFWPSSGFRINTSLGFNVYERQYIFEKEILKGSTQLLYGILNISKNWNKKVTLQSNTHLSVYHYSLPSVFTGDYQRVSAEWWQTLNFRKVLKKNWVFQGSVDYYNNNMFTPNQASFVLSDAELSWNPKDKKLSYRVRLENITNQKKFFRSDFSPSSQTFFSIPLIGRNIIFFVRMEL